MDSPPSTPLDPVLRPVSEDGHPEDIWRDAFGRPLRSEWLYASARAREIVQDWLTRVDEEGVRDAQGRRLPAHAIPFPIRMPRDWWFCRHVGWRWERRPIWSWSRRPPPEMTVVRTGENPAPLGNHPHGGWPMQGQPSARTRGEWPPDPAKRYPWMRAG